MGHWVESSERMFREVCYRKKTTAEIRAAMEAKQEQIARLSNERKHRVERLCEEYNITPTRLADLILQYHNDSDDDFVSYQNQGDGTGQLIPSGVIANIVREKEMIESERGQARKLELVLRNIREDEMYFNPRTGEANKRPCIHTLTDSELEYLGF